MLSSDSWFACMQLIEEVAQRDAILRNTQMTFKAMILGEEWNDQHYAIHSVCGNCFRLNRFRCDELIYMHIFEMCRYESK